MFKKRRRYIRRPSRRGVKRDIQTLSVSWDQTAVIRGPADPVLGPNNPFAEAIVLWHGGKHTEAGFTVQETAPGLQDTGGRGVSVRGIQFDWSGFTSCWLWQNTVGQDQTAHYVSHYMAFVKAEFDQQIYQTTGQVVPKWSSVPNIVKSARDIAINSGNEHVFDPGVDIIWRGYQEAMARPCTLCFPCPSDIGCPDLSTEDCQTTFLGTPGIAVTGTVNLPLNATSYSAVANNYNMRHVKLRTSRFLKEDECIVLVSNWVTTIPADSQLVWSNNLYGSIAVRVAR